MLAAMRILVTGATGYLGRAIVRAVIDGGHQVIALVRDPAAAATALGELAVEPRKGDVRDEASVRAALDDIDVLVHAAATYSYARRDGPRMIEQNPAIAEAVLGAAAAVGTSHVIDVSSAGVFKAHPDGPKAGLTDDESPLWGPSDREWNDPYLCSKVLAEQAARAWRDRGLPISSIHPTLTIGPDDRVPGVSGAILVSLLADPCISIAGNANWVDVRDVAAGVAGIVGRSPGARALFAARELDFRGMAALLDRSTGRRPRRFWLSAGITRAGAMLNDVVGGALMRALPSRDTLEFALGVGHVDGATGEATIGRAYRPLEETVAESLTWWAERGTIPRSWAGTLVEAATR
jgi:dihydroflavonol-4-reductase